MRLAQKLEDFEQSALASEDREQIVVATEMNELAELHHFHLWIAIFCEGVSQGNLQESHELEEFLFEEALSLLFQDFLLLILVFQYIQT